MKKIIAIIGLTMALLFTTTVVAPPQAQAAGAVANSCAVTANVTATKKAFGGGVYYYSLGCGQAMSNVYWATVHGYPFYVKVYGTAPRCYRAGQLFYPNNSGYERTAILTPTVRC